MIYNAFALTPLEDVKVVVIGQDPYHEKGQAMGLAFSVPNDCKCPPSLINIFKEIENEFGEPCKREGDLTYLTKQGVFLINTILTVEEGKPMSHKNKNYSKFIQELLGFLDKIDNFNNQLIIDTSSLFTPILRRSLFISSIVIDQV